MKKQIYALHGQYKSKSLNDNYIYILNDLYINIFLTW